MRAKIGRLSDEVVIHGGNHYAGIHGFTVWLEQGRMLDGEFTSDRGILSRGSSASEKNKAEATNGFMHGE